MLKHLLKKKRDLKKKKIKKILLFNIKEQKTKRSMKLNLKLRESRKKKKEKSNV